MKFDINDLLGLEKKLRENQSKFNDALAAHINECPNCRKRFDEYKLSTRPREINEIMLCFQQSLKKKALDLGIKA